MTDPFLWKLIVIAAFILMGYAVGYAAGFEAGRRHDDHHAGR